MEFRYSRTSEEIDRGMDMRFHPLCGREVMSLYWDDRRKQYYYQMSGSAGGWAFIEPIGGKTYFPRIGDGKDHAKGEPYLLHWLYDPLTGKSLEKIREMKRERQLFDLTDPIFQAAGGVDEVGARKMIACYQAMFRVLTETREPTEWLTELYKSTWPLLFSWGRFHLLSEALLDCPIAESELLVAEYVKQLKGS